MNLIRECKCFCIGLFAFINLLCVSCSNPKTLFEVRASKVNLCDSISVNYKVYGKGKEAIVFVHGFGCDLYAWEKQFESLKKYKETKLVFIDLPGYGNSSKPHVNYDLHFFASAVDAVVCKEKLFKPVLVGHSLGTPICRQYCFEHPDGVTALCDLDGVYCFYKGASEEYQTVLEMFAAMFKGEKCSENITSFVSSLAGPNTPKEITEYAMSVMPKTEEYVAWSTMSNLIDKRWWTGEHIDVPTHVICSINSGIPHDNELKMKELYPLSAYMELTDCGHFIQLENPDIVTTSVRVLKSYFVTSAAK